MLDATRLRALVAVARHGSVTAAAQSLNYAQPSISHHIARLEAETGAKLMERSGRGVRLTDAGHLLAERAEEILGRLDAAEAELAAHIGLRQGRVRLATFASALGVLIPAAAAKLRSERPTTDLTAVQAEPSEALRLLRAGLTDVALIFEYHQADAESDPPAEPDGGAPAGQRPMSAADESDSMITDETGFRAQLVLQEPVYLISGREPADQGAKAASAPPAWNSGNGSGHQGSVTTSPRSAAAGLAGHADDRWIAGCTTCSGFLLAQCAAAGFSPQIAFTTDDYVSCQALVAAGLGVALLPGLALRAARHPGITAKALPGAHRRILAVTYGDPPDPPASALLIEALIQAAAASHRS
jgi:DNA-binding transcriptional LysR family regulator